MSSLTEEQLRRIEESRRKALQLRTQRQALAGAAQASTASSALHAPSASSPVNVTDAWPQHLNNSRNHPSSSVIVNCHKQQSCDGTTSKGLVTEYNQPSTSSVSLQQNADPVKSVSGKRVASLSNIVQNDTPVARRIAESKRLALERRATKQKQMPLNMGMASACGSVESGKITSSSSHPPQLEKNTGSFYSSSKRSGSFQPTLKNNHLSTGKHGSAPLGNVLQPSQTNSSASSGSPSGAGLPSFTKTINGTFRLISIDRFLVDITYHPQAVNIFKTMDTRNYDPKTHKWNFHISDHEKLVSALAPLRPAVCVGALPAFVIKVVRKVAKQPSSSSIVLDDLEPQLRDALMPFQAEAVCFGLREGGRIMLADDMGLGKTIQALGIAVSYRHEWPLLVVSPSSMKYTWRSAIERWVSSVCEGDVMVVGSGRDSMDGAAVVIMSYDLLAKRAKEVLGHNFQVVIMDESHMLKGFKTARYKAAAPVMQQARRVLLLSGTPALSRPSELYTQIKGIDPTLFPSFQDFGVRYCGARQQPWGWDYSGFSNMEELQIILEARLMVRRLKSQVLSQLPSKQRMTVMLDPSSVKSGSRSMEQAAHMFGLKSSGPNRQGALLQYFSETAQAKLQAVSEYVKELLEADKKFLVFGHHQVMLDKLCQVCEDNKIKYIRIDGRTTAEQRQYLVKLFQNSADYQVAVLSITACNSGLTLTAAQMVLFAELFWNPGILVQAEDRVHRIGQKDSVLVQYLIARGTADDHIWPLVQSKLEVLGQAGLCDQNLSDVTTKQHKKTDQEDIRDFFFCLDDPSTEPCEEPQ